MNKYKEPVIFVQNKVFIRWEMYVPFLLHLGNGRNIFILERSVHFSNKVRTDTVRCGKTMEILFRS